MDRQILVDRLLGTSNLTDELEDDAANELLNWAVSQVDGLMADGADEATVNQRIYDLMQLMRGVNKWASKPQSFTEGVLQEFTQSYLRVFGDVRNASGDERARVVAQLAELNPKDALIYLLNWLKPQDNS